MDRLPPPKILWSLSPAVPLSLRPSNHSVHPSKYSSVGHNPFTHSIHPSLYAPTHLYIKQIYLSIQQSFISRCLSNAYSSPVKS